MKAFCLINLFLIIFLRKINCSDDELHVVELPDNQYEKDWKAFELINTPKFFDQLLDHADENFGTWKQRYFVDDRFNKNNRTVFLFIGGENSMTPFSMQDTQWINYAKEFGALIFYLEHRFYGHSHPKTRCDDLTEVCFKKDGTKMLSFLKSSYALKDIHYFHNAMTSQYELADAKWIAFGTSYSGSLAAWMRLFYPDIIDGAVASSAPVLATFNFKESIPITRRSIENYSLECVDAIKNALQIIRESLETRNGRRMLIEEFNLCSDSLNRQTTLKDIFFMHSTIYNHISNLVQNNEIDEATGKSSIATFCDIMTSDKDVLSVLTRFRQALGNTETCFSYNYNDMIDRFQNISSNSDFLNSRSWLYQQCTEFGFFITTEQVQDWFGVDIMTPEYYANLCGDVFGSRFGQISLIEESIVATNKRYHGFDIVNKVTNVVFVHGSLDHWHALGITESDNPEAPAIFIPGAAHSSDIDPSSSKDSEQLRSARHQISRLIGKWLKSEMF